MPARHPEGLEHVEAKENEELRELLPDWAALFGEEPPVPPPAESPPPEVRVQASRLGLSDLEAVAKELLVGAWDLEDALWVLAQVCKAEPAQHYKAGLNRHGNTVEVSRGTSEKPWFAELSAGVFASVANGPVEERVWELRTSCTRLGPCS